jgi:hypothetical protein
MIAFVQKEYRPYTISHVDAFELTEIQAIYLPKKCPISVVDKKNMSILIGQFGDFPEEQQLMDQAKAWFDKIYKECFSIN